MDFPGRPSGSGRRLPAPLLALPSCNYPHSPPSCEIMCGAKTSSKPLDLRCVSQRRSHRPPTRDAPRLHSARHTGLRYRALPLRNHLARASRLPLTFRPWSGRRFLSSRLPLPSRRRNVKRCPDPCLGSPRRYKHLVDEASGRLFVEPLRRCRECSPAHPTGSELVVVSARVRTIVRLPERPHFGVGVGVRGCLCVCVCTSPSPRPAFRIPGLLPTRDVRGRSAPHPLVDTR